MKGRWWSDRRQHQDEDKIASTRQTLANIAELRARKDEVGFVALVKKLRPGVTPDELEKLIETFRDSQ